MPTFPDGPPTLKMNGAAAAAATPLPPAEVLPAQGAFQRLLPSTPIRLSVGGWTGHTGSLAVVYDAARCFGLADERKTWPTVAALDAEIAAGVQEMTALLQAHDEEWRDVRAARARATGLWAELWQMIRGLASPMTPPASPEEHWAKLVRMVAAAEVPASPTDAERDEEYLRAISAVADRTAEIEAQLTELRFRRAEQLIPFLVISIGVPARERDPLNPLGPAVEVLAWPFDTPATAPNPAQPADWAIFDPRVLDWITREGVTLVQREAQSPLFGRRSRAG